MTNAPNPLPGAGVDGQPTRTGSFIVRLVITTIILAVLVARIDMAGVADAIQRSIGGWFLAALAMGGVGLIISTLKWRDLLQALGLTLGIWDLFKLYLIGGFASTFLPGAIGGDLARWHLTRQRIGAGMKVATTILVERSTGAMVLLVLSLPATSYLVPEGFRARVIALAGVGGLALIGGAWLVLNRRLPHKLSEQAKGGRFRRIFGPLFRLQDNLRDFSRKPLLATLGYSSLFYLTSSLTFYLVALAFGAGITFLEAASVQILIMLLILVPVSLGGLGLAQLGDVYLLGTLGVAPPDALGMSLVRLLVKYSYALLGAFLFFRWRTPKANG